MADDVVIRLSARGGPQTKREVDSVTTSIGKIGAAAKDAERQAAGSLGNLDRKLRALGQVDAGQGLKSLGNKLTLGVTAPLALAGTAVTKLSLDFDRSFSRIIGLTDVTADQAAKMRDQVLELAKATGQSPQALAEGLYFVASAGIDASKVMDVLTVSAEAAAAGLGDTQTVAGLVTGVMGAYGKAAGTAAQTTDALVAAVRVGRAEPAAFAETLGRVLPFAAQLGVSFNDIAAAVAVMSNGAIDADVATTGLRQVLADILNPAEQSKKALLDLGINSEQLRKVLREKGLLATLQLLQQMVGGNTEALGQIIPDVRALTAVLSITNQDADKTAKVFAATADSTGSLSDAFNTFINSDPGQMSTAMAEAQAAMIEFGNAILPLAADVLPKLADIVGKVADAFASLPAPLQTLLVFGGVAAAAVGPFVRLAGTIQQLRYFNLALTGATKAATGATVDQTAAVEIQNAMVKASGLTLGNVIGKFAGYTAAFYVLGEAAQFVTDRITDWKYGVVNVAQLGDALVDFGQKSKIAGELSRQFGDDLGGLKGKLDDIDVTLGDRLTGKNSLLGGVKIGPIKFAQNSGVEDAQRDIGALDKSLADLVSGGHADVAAKIFDQLGAAVTRDGGNVKDLKSALPGYAAAQANANTQAKLGGDAMGRLGTQSGAAERQIGDVTQTLKDWADSLPLNKVLDAAAATRSYQDEVAKLGDMQAKWADEDKQRTQAVVDAKDSLTTAQGRLSDAEEKYQEALAGSTKLERERLQVSLEQARVSAGQAALDLSQAQERQSRLSSGASPKARAEAAQAVAAAQAGLDDANTRVKESQQAIDDATPGSIGYQKHLAEAAQGVRDAQKDVAAATDKVREAQQNAKPSAQELAQRQRDVADQMDRIVKAAEQDITLNLDQPQQATQELYDRLKALVDLFPQLQPLLDTFMKSTDVPLKQFTHRDASGHIVVTEDSGGVVSGPTMVRVGAGINREAWIPDSLGASRAAGLLGTAASWYGMRVVPMDQGGILGAGGRQFAQAQVVVVEKQTTVENYNQNGDVRLDDDFEGYQRWQRKNGRVQSLSRGSRGRR